MRKKRIDLLAIDKHERLIIIELKTGYLKIFDAEPGEDMLRYRIDHMQQTQGYFYLWNFGPNSKKFGKVHKAYIYYVDLRKMIKVADIRTWNDGNDITGPYQQ